MTCPPPTDKNKLVLFALEKRLLPKREKNLALKRKNKLPLNVATVKHTSLLSF